MTGAVQNFQSIMYMLYALLFLGINQYYISTDYANGTQPFSWPYASEATLNDLGK